MGPIIGAAKVFMFCRMATDPQIIIIVPYFIKLDHFALNYHSRKISTESFVTRLSMRHLRIALLMIISGRKITSVDRMIFVKEK